MPDMEVTVQFEVYCSCGRGMCGETLVRNGWSGSKIVVNPCPDCMSKAEDEEYERGYSEGIAEKG